MDPQPEHSTSDLARLLPGMSRYDFNRLAKSIEEYRLIEPIAARPGEVIDGRHRH